MYKISCFCHAFYVSRCKHRSATNVTITCDVKQVQVVPLHDIQAYGEVKVYLHRFLTSEVDTCHLQAPFALTPEKQSLKEFQTSRVI